MTSTSANINRWRAFALLAVSFFMTIIDLTIVNVSLPTIGRDLHFSATSLQWVVTAYALTFGGFMLLGGRAADLLGRRRILMVGLVVVYGGVAGVPRCRPAKRSLIAAGPFRGSARRSCCPAALSIVMNMFDEGAERNKALGIWGGLGAGGATVGVIAGGLLTRYAGWQYIFYLNVPIGAAALVARTHGSCPTAGLPPRAGGLTRSVRSPARAGWCCWWTRSPRHRSTAGAPRGRSRCWRHRRRCSSRSW